MSNATNMALLRVLGITQRDITSLQISMLPNQPPMVTMDCMLDASKLLQERAYFDLGPRAPLAPEATPPLDLDALCATARTRLTAEVQHSASMALADQHRETAAIRARMGKARARHSDACARALAQLDMACTPRPRWSIADALASGGIFAGSLGGLLGAEGLLP